MINLFDFNSTDNTDFAFLLQSAGHNVKINGTNSKALITNPKINVMIDYDDRYISTTDTIKAGDIIDYSNCIWQ